MRRPKHPDPELEVLLRSLELQGWAVDKGKRYYKAKCPPPCRSCFKTVKLTPSDPNYTKNLRGWFRGSGCWQEM